MMTLDKAPINKKLVVLEISDLISKSSDMESRLMHLGFLETEPLMIVQTAPYFGHPILVEIKGRRIALSLEEAKIIKVGEA